MSFRDIFPFRHHTVPSIYHDDDAMHNFRREFERIFGDFTRHMPSLYHGGWRGSESTGYLSPRVNISESAKEFHLDVELPGVVERDIDIELNNDQLTLRAEHSEQTEQSDEKKHFHLVESAYGSYFRRFDLPFTPESDKVTARLRNGVLTITIPQSQGAGKNGKKIAVLP
ncbi:MAG: Hsp20/alpha crystallin family protein [Candidatus Symbiobacter sp.]|nr:Hsp20/alpha crystallin family protein [Candidatus Symbiobacter sp.]